MDIYEYLAKKFTLIKREKYREYDLSNNTKKILCDIIVIYLSYEDIMKDTDDGIDQTIQEIREKFDMIDAQALSSEENWWSIILEQVELGLM